MDDRIVIRRLDRFPGYYVSECGRTFSTRLADRDTGNYAWQMREMKASVQKSTGYRAVMVFDDNGKPSNIRVHRLVCEAFYGLPKRADLEVRHLDGIRTNNHKANLRWGTRKENVADMVRHGRSQKGKAHGAKISERDVYRIRDLYDSRFLGPTAIGHDYGIGKAQVIHIGLRRQWKSLPEVGPGVRSRDRFPSGHTRRVK